MTDVIQFRYGIAVMRPEFHVRFLPPPPLTAWEKTVAVVRAVIRLTVYSAVALAVIGLSVLGFTVSPQTFIPAAVSSFVFGLVFALASMRRR